MRRSARGRRAQPITAAEAATWYQGKTFIFDWTSWHFPNWIKLLRRKRKRPIRVLEIGSWEGRSALFFLNYLPKSRLTCIDTFEGGKEHQHADAKTFLPQIERHFLANTKPFRKRIEIVKARSVDALAALGIRNRRFELAYIDGSHLAVDVYSDAMLVWPLMTRGGLVIFDDYLWREVPERLDRPKPGIDAFLGAIEGQYRLVLDGYQIAIVKR